MENLLFIVYIVFPLFSFYIFFRKWTYEDKRIIRLKRAVPLLSVIAAGLYCNYLSQHMGVDSGWFSVVYLLNAFFLVGVMLMLFSFVRKYFLTPKNKK